MKRLIDIFGRALLPLLMLAGGTSAHAQFNDPINTAVNASHAMTAAADALDQFFVMLDQFDLTEEQLERMTEWKDRMQGWRDDIQAAKGFIDQVSGYAAMAKMLEQQVQMLVYYANTIKSLGSGPYSPYFVSTLLNYATNMGYTVQGLIDSIKTIMREDGIDKAQREDMIAKKVEEGKGIIMNTEAKLIDEIAFLTEVRQIVDLGNKFIGREPGTGMDRVGADGSGRFVPISPAVSAAPKPDPESVRLGGGVGGVLYRIILVIIGISCLGSLIFALSRYIQGQPGAEMMFVRIFAVIVIAVVVFSVLGSIFKFI